MKNRQSIQLRNYDYSQSGFYFITICIQNRQCLFGEIKNNVVYLNEFGEYANDLWLGLPNRYTHISLDEFIIMPNHMHAIVVIHQNNVVGAIHELPLQRRKMLLPKIIGYYKMNTSKRINLTRSTPQHRVWQRNYYDHIIRNEHDLTRIRKYIRDNPLKWNIDKENPQNK